MPDLSDLLGDVYGGEESHIHSQPTPPVPPPAPSWADEGRLDGFFAGWMPEDGEVEDADGGDIADIADGGDAEAGPQPYDPGYDAVFRAGYNGEFGLLSEAPRAPERPALPVLPPAGGRLDDDLAEALSAALAAAPSLTGVPAREAAPSPWPFEDEPEAVEAPAPELPVLEPLRASSFTDLAAAPLAPVAAEPVAAAPLEEVPVHVWQRSDDDLLPTRRGRRGRRRR